MQICGCIFLNLILFKCVVEQLITFENNILLEKLTLVWIFDGELTSSHETPQTHLQNFQKQKTKLDIFV